MENTASKNEINVEASHSTPKHISDQMRVEGTIDGWPLSNPTFTRRRAPISVGRVAIFRGVHGSWGPHLQKGQVIVVESFGRRHTARVERFLSASTRTSRYHRGASTPLPSSYVVLVDSIIDLELVR